MRLKLQRPQTVDPLKLAYDRGHEEGYRKGHVAGLKEGDDRFAKITIPSSPYRGDALATASYTYRAELEESIPTRELVLIVRSVYETRINRDYSDCSYDGGGFEIPRRNWNYIIRVPLDAVLRTEVAWVNEDYLRQHLRALIGDMLPYVEPLSFYWYLRQFFWSLVSDQLRLYNNDRSRLNQRQQIIMVWYDFVGELSRGRES